MLITYKNRYLFFQTKVIDAIYPHSDGIKGLLPALKRICSQAAAGAREGYTLIVLSDKNAGRLPGIRH